MFSANWIVPSAMTKLHVSQLARTQLFEIGRYTRRKFGVSQAKQLSINFGKLFSRIADFPLSGEVDEHHDRLRRAILTPFAVLYQVGDDDMVIIVAILHGARDRASLDIP
jgi:plasmid stabilization system protein ParE